MSEHDRDLAEAIHHQLISPDSVDAALNLWNERAHLLPQRRMWDVLAHTSANALDAVLARRQSEAARTGPWDECEEVLAICREKLAAMMIRVSIATGHGDTFDDLLGELEAALTKRCNP